VQLPHVLQALSARHTVEVLVVRKPEQAYVEQFLGTRVLRVPVSGSTARDEIESYRRALRRQLLATEYDAVHVCDGWAAGCMWGGGGGGGPVLALRDRLGFAVIFDPGRGPMAQGPIADERLAAELERDELACVREADLVLAPTLPALRWLEAHGAAGRARLVPPGVDIDRFDWDHPPPAGPVAVLCAGLVRRGRGLRVLLRAMAGVCARVDARLVLAGPIDPGFALVLARDQRELGLGERVELLGPVDHDAMPARIARATVCVVPAALELGPRPTALYPTKLLEYMACLRAVVAPRRGTVTMLLKDGQDGALFTPGDHVHLAAQILRLLTAPELRERFARRAYAEARERHPASATRRAVRDAYAQLGHRLRDDERPAPGVVVVPPRADDRGDTAEITDPSGGIAAADPPRRGAAGAVAAGWVAIEDPAGAPTSAEVGSDPPAGGAEPAPLGWVVGFGLRGGPPPTEVVAPAAVSGPTLPRTPRRRPAGTAAPRPAGAPDGNDTEPDERGAGLPAALLPGSREPTGGFTAAGVLLCNPPREFDDEPPTRPRARAPGERGPGATRSAADRVR
jgi:glycosyltransferase involved in cell wall biosynthesis